MSYLSYLVIMQCSDGWAIFGHYNNGHMTTVKGCMKSEKEAYFYAASEFFVEILSFDEWLSMLPMNPPHLSDVYDVEDEERGVCLNEGCNNEAEPYGDVCYRCLLREGPDSDDWEKMIDHNIQDDN